MNGMLKYLKKNLLDVIRDSSTIFIVGHNEPDFDSIGSSIGLLTICRFFGRKAYIVVNDADTNLEPGVRKIIDDYHSQFNIIDKATFEKLFNANTSLIITDTNKGYLVSVKDYLDKFRHKIIIDHHAEDNNSIEAEYTFINPSMSSASEIVAQILTSYHYPYDPIISTCLLAGIELDTNHYRNNTTDKTHDTAEKLILRGADPKLVAKLFRPEFETDRRINDLIYNGTIFEKYGRSIFNTRHVSFTLNRSQPTAIYRKEDLAKTADKMLDYSMDATFALGYVNDEVISISARSKSDIDVGSIMSMLGGGGNACSAACKIASSNITDVEGQLKEAVASIVAEMPDTVLKDLTVIAPPTNVESKVYLKIKEPQKEKSHV